MPLEHAVWTGRMPTVGGGRAGNRAHSKGVEPASRLSPRGRPVPPFPGGGGAGPSLYRLNRTSPTTVRRRMSPKMCCWMSWLKRFVTFSSVVTAPLFHRTPKLPFTIV